MLYVPSIGMCGVQNITLLTKIQRMKTDQIIIANEQTQHLASVFGKSLFEIMSDRT